MFSFDSLRNAFASNIVRTTTKPNLPPPPPTIHNAASPPINLMRGWPHPSLLPADLIREAALKALSDTTVSTAGLLYGPDPGYEPCREAIATWLSAFYSSADNAAPVTASRLCITGGASQNLGSMLAVYTDPAFTRKIWIVAPAYMLAFRIFEDAGFGEKMKGIPEDDRGIDLAALRRGLEKSEEEAGGKEGSERPVYKPERKRAKVYKHVLYCVPTFSNPSSRTMSLEHRTELVRIAREFDVLLVADDVYDFLQWPADASHGSLDAAMQTAHLPRLVDIDRDLEGGADRPDADGFGNACSNGTFSKIVGPGVRVGWVEGTDKFTYGVSQAGTTASGGAPSNLTSTYLTHLLASGSLTTHITSTLLPSYTSRSHTLHAAIHTHLLPLGFSLPQTDRQVFGGYFVWLSLPPGMSAGVLARRCREEAGVIVAAGGIFEVPEEKGGEEKEEGGSLQEGFDGFVRLCFAWEEEEKLEEGVRLVGEVVVRMIGEGGGGTRNLGGGRGGGGEGCGLDVYK
ncbi:Valine--pyruvate aminotransferase [Friedmanniomyces endolithicus]|nr:Valine--pyruvate aminotransferase [Friedmanniomyces endolithicus]